MKHTIQYWRMQGLLADIIVHFTYDILIYTTKAGVRAS